MTREDIIANEIFQAFSNQCVATFNLKADLQIAKQKIAEQEREITKLKEESKNIKSDKPSD